MSRVNWENCTSIPSSFFIFWRKTRKFSVSILVWSSFCRSRENWETVDITPRLLLVGKCLGKLRKCSVLLLICLRRFMETRKFPIEFPVCSSFCLGEPGGSRKFLGVLPVYSSFGTAFSGQIREFSISFLVSSWFPFDLLHFNQSQVLLIDNAKWTKIVVLLQGCRDSSAACSLLSFRCFVATFGAKEYPQGTKHNLQVFRIASGIKNWRVLGVVSGGAP